MEIKQQVDGQEMALDALLQVYSLILEERRKRLAQQTTPDPDNKDQQEVTSVSAKSEYYCNS